jgi:signal transduction histidine kinase
MEPNRSQPPLKMRSIRTKLLVRLSILILVVFAILWVIVADRSYVSLYSALDEALMARAEGIAALLSYDPKNSMIILRENEELLDEFSEEEHGFFQISDASTGEVLFVSPSSRDTSISSLVRRIPSTKKSKRTFWNGSVRGEALRLVRWHFYPEKREIAESGNAAGASFLRKPFHLKRDEGAPPLLQIILGIEREGVDRRYIQILGYTGGTLLVVFLVVAVLTNLLLAFSFRSLTQLSREVDQIEKLPAVSPVTEWRERETGTVARAVNALLKRLEKSIEWERQMTANVAHELRTPLSALRNVLEVSLNRERKKEECIEALSESLSITGQMQRLIENLLQLARLESGELTTHVEEIKLSQLIGESWSLFEGKAVEKEQDVRITIAEDLAVFSDREKMRIIFNNLFDNAVEYTPAHGTVTIRAQKLDRQDYCECVIENSGEPLSEGRINDIFKRFYREDRTRTAGMHFGLGLSLVKSICELLGIGIIASSPASGGAGRPGTALSITLKIPLNRP